MTHEEAVATLKSITDKVTLVVGKTNLAPPSSSSMNNSTSTGSKNTLFLNMSSSIIVLALLGLGYVTSHSTGALNHHDQLDFGRSPSPANGLTATSRSHSPTSHRKLKMLYFYFIFLNVIFIFNLGLESSSRYASSNVLAAVPPGTPRAVSTEDITR